MAKDRAMRGFVIHLSIYVGVVGLLAALNLHRHPDHIWFIWVLAGWGIGVAAHDLCLLLQRTGRREAIFTDPKLRAFSISVFVFVAVNALLITVNLIYTPTKYWFVYPLLAWSVLLAVQAYTVFRRKPPGPRTPAASRTGRKS
jgi:hypothetical protein